MPLFNRNKMTREQKKAQTNMVKANRWVARVEGKIADCDPKKISRMNRLHDELRQAKDTRDGCVRTFKRLTGDD